MAERMVRAGSVWRRRKSGVEVRIVKAPRLMDARGREQTQTRMVLGVCVNDPDTGIIQHEVDFREQYEWVRGRDSRVDAPAPPRGDGVSILAPRGMKDY